jgi:hypothetical protein
MLRPRTPAGGGGRRSHVQDAAQECNSKHRKPYATGWGCPASWTPTCRRTGRRWRAPSQPCRPGQCSGGRQLSGEGRWKRCGWCCRPPGQHLRARVQAALAFAPDQAKATLAQHRAPLIVGLQVPTKAAINRRLLLSGLDVPDVHPRHGALRTRLPPFLWQCKPAQLQQACGWPGVGCVQGRAAGGGGGNSGSSGRPASGGHAASRRKYLLDTDCNGIVFHELPRLAKGLARRLSCGFRWRLKPLADTTGKYMDKFNERATAHQ